MAKDLPKTGTPIGGHSPKPPENALKPRPSGSDDSDAGEIMIKQAVKGISGRMHSETPHYGRGAHVRL